MIEMIFVLGIVTIFMHISFAHLIDSSSLKFAYLKELLIHAQSDSMRYHKINEITISHSTITVNDIHYSLKPLICDDASFHYTPQATISHADTIRCYGRHEHAFTLQLGSGWILDE